MAIYIGFYIYFKAFKDWTLKGFKRILGLHGAFLSIILITISKDSNNQIYLVAWVLVSIKGKTIENYSLSI